MTTMIPAAPVVSTIPSGAPFVDALAAGLLARHGDGPDALVSLTVLLPTRRACLALRDAFLRLGGGNALLLPRLMPLGDVDADEIEPEVGGALSGEDSADLPPEISELERRLILARLILKTGGDQPITRADQAARLAAELARLLDHWLPLFAVPVKQRPDPSGVLRRAVFGPSPQLIAGDQASALRGSLPQAKEVASRNLDFGVREQCLDCLGIADIATSDCAGVERPSPLRVTEKRQPSWGTTV